LNHYTYQLSFSDGKKYIGVRSCKCNITEDSGYLGSSKHIPTELYENCEKEILKVFDTRVEAVLHEIELHNKYDIAVNPKYYNKAKQTATGFDSQGLTKNNSSSVLQSAKSSRKYRGIARTEAQLAADKQTSIREKGRKNSKKGNIGINSPKYKPWYYVTPDYEYIEVYDSISNYIRKGIIPGVTKINGLYFMQEYLHKPIRKGKLRGYTFGYIHSKPEILTQENLDMMLKLSEHILKMPDVHKIKGQQSQNKRALKTGQYIKEND